MPGRPPRARCGLFRRRRSRSTRITMGARSASSSTSSDVPAASGRWAASPRTCGRRMRVRSAPSCAASRTSWSATRVGDADTGIDITSVALTAWPLPGSRQGRSCSAKAKRTWPPPSRATARTAGLLNARPNTTPDGRHAVARSSSRAKVTAQARMRRAPARSRASVARADRVPLGQLRRLRRPAPDRRARPPTSSRAPALSSRAAAPARCSRSAPSTRSPPTNAIRLNMNHRAEDVVGKADVRDRQD